MPHPTPFHPRTSALCRSYLWKDWAGRHAVCVYETGSDREYFSFRENAGVLDASPLFKARVGGPDAARLLSRVFSRDVTQLGVGRVAYGCLIDPAGKLLDDGTVHVIDEGWYRLSTSEPWLGWLHRHARGLDVTLADETDAVAALAIQGPRSREVLAGVAPVAGKLRFFRVRRATIAGVDVQISRTGYTGDLGYEVWCPSEHALAVWDAIWEAGRPVGLEACGLDALDVTRIEAGFVLQGVDYVSARACLTERRKSTADEAGLDWTIELDREPWVGSAAIRAERARPAAWKLVGLELSWADLEALYARYDLPPDLPARVSRDPVPIYDASRRFVGYATSRAWSPILKKPLALATVEARLARPGTEVHVEHTAEFERATVRARVVERPFFDPPRKREAP